MSKPFRNYYHAGLSPITKFNINKGGLHLGGRFSALEAAARKLRCLDGADKESSRIYLHSVFVDDRELQEVYDCGGNSLWEVWIKEWKKVGLAGARYKNEFEPDMRHSIILCDNSLIKGISKIEVLTLDQTEGILSEAEKHLYFL